MTEHRIFTMPFSSVYPLYLKKQNEKIVQKRKLTKSFIG